MKEIKNLDDIYNEVKEIILLLRENEKYMRFAITLDQQVYHTSWTTGTELLQEIKHELETFVYSNEMGIDLSLFNKIKNVLVAIENVFSFQKKNSVFKK